MTYEEFAVAIGRRVKVILREKGMKQKEFARLMETSESQISTIINGQANLTLAVLWKIQESLGVPIVVIPEGKHREVDNGYQHPPAIVEYPAEGMSTGGSAEPVPFPPSFEYQYEEEEDEEYHRLPPLPELDIPLVIKE